MCPKVEEKAIRARSRARLRSRFVRPIVRTYSCAAPYGIRKSDIEHTALKPHYENLLRRLNDSSVSFVIIGAIAVSIAGYNRLTRDLDAVCRDLCAMVSTLYETGCNRSRNLSITHKSGYKYRNYTTEFTGGHGVYVID